MEKKFRITSLLENAKFSDELTADVELFPEGSWKHEAAPSGWFNVDKDRIQTFISNFNRGVCGYEIPLEFSHMPDSKTTPGWITKMYEKLNDDGTSSLWATMKLTDKEIAQRIKDGSLKYISPTVISDYLDTGSGQTFEVIRSATLTNYPHIKKLQPISVNFEEIKNKEEKNMLTFNEILEKNDLELENVDEITLEDLDKGDINLDYLTSDQIEKLAEKFEMTVAQFQEKYPAAGGKMYGNRPKIKAPDALKGATAEQKKAFFAAFNAMYDKHKDVDKATSAALKKVGIKLEEEDEDPEKGKAKLFMESVAAYLKKTLHLKEKEDDEDIDAITLDEVKKEVAELRAFKLRAEFAEDVAYLEKFTLTPAVRKIAETLLASGRRAVLKFEDQTTSVHDLVQLLFEEFAKNPTENPFKVKSVKEEESVDLAEDLNKAAVKLQESNPTWTYRQALDKAYADRNSKK